MCYGNRIKSYLDEQGIKYTMLSLKTGIPINILSPMLNGKRKIIVEEYVAICNALGKSTDFFVPNEKSA